MHSWTTRYDIAQGVTRGPRQSDLSPLLRYCHILHLPGSPGGMRVALGGGHVANEGRHSVSNNIAGMLQRAAAQSAVRPAIIERDG